MNRREIVLAGMSALLLALVVQGPCLYAALTVDHFTGSLEDSYYFDASSYRAWVRQAADGHFLFANPYTSSEATGRHLFHPLFLSLGLIDRWLGIPSLVVWCVARLLFAAAAALSLYLFARIFLETRGLATTGALLVALGAGFGWEFVMVDRAYAGLDYGVAEITFFQSMRYPILLSAALILMMGGLAAAYRAIAEGTKWAAIVAGIVVALLAFVHPYDVITLAGVTAAFLVVETAHRRTLDRVAITNCILIGIVAAPAVLVQAYIAYTDPVLAAPNRVPMPSPWIHSYAAAYGLLLVLAGLGARAAWRSGVKGRFLVTWAIAGFALLYAPVAYQRRLAVGLIIPIGFLAAFWVEAEISRVLAARRPRAALGLVVLLACLPLTNVLVTVEDWRTAMRPVFPYALSSDLAAALAWLDSQPPGVVLAEEDVANVVPALTRHRVYSGHWALTPDHLEKYAAVTWLLAGRLTDEERAALVGRSGARYLIYGPQERALTALAGGTFDPTALGRVVFSNDGVVIVEIEDL